VHQQALASGLGAVWPRPDSRTVLFLHLRQLAGLEFDVFMNRFGSSLTDEFPHVRDLAAEGLLSEDPQRIALTPKGLLIADSIFASFF
jgi:coproporphyrinogen III oxidase-like Fe-S oxidoreductase